MKTSIYKEDWMWWWKQCAKFTK